MSPTKETGEYYEEEGKPEKRKKSDAHSKKDTEEAAKSVKQEQGLKKTQEQGSKSVKQEQGMKSVKLESGLKAVKQEKMVKEEPLSLYQTILGLERRESENRDAVGDHAIWRQTCSDLRGIMKQIFELKMKKGACSVDISELRIQASLLFVTLKKLNRLEKLRIKRSRDTTNQSKQGVDSFNLQLQNLLYEVLHLKKEVTKCVNFKSLDEGISLVPESEFFSEAPPSIARPELSSSTASQHHLKLARLEWELEKRKALSEEAEKREVERDSLEQDIRQKEEKLRDLRPQLASILEVTKPVQDYLGLPLDHQRDQARLARLLPPPLYICYTQVAAYQQANDPLLEVTVRGDREEAVKWKEEQRKKEEEEMDLEEEEDNVEEQESQDDETGGGKKRGKSSVKAEAAKEAVLGFHPLSVGLVVKAPGILDTWLVLTFHFLPVLGVVTVRTSLGGETKVTGEAVEPGSMLTHLYPGDSGLSLPSPAQVLLLREAGIHKGDSLSPLLPGHLPYGWAQALCGLNFLPEQPNNPSPEPEVSRERVRDTVQCLRERLVARLDLANQLNMLAKCKSTDHLLPFSLAGTYPARQVSRLKVWCGVDWETYSQVPFTRHLTAYNIVDENDFLFKATCMRDKATLLAYVAIKPDYPLRAPIFCLSLNGVGPRAPDCAPRPPGSPRLQGESQDTSEWVRDFEMELNLNWEDQLPVSSSRTGLLAAQLHRMLVMMDVVLEAASESQQGQDKAGTFTKSQVFFSAMRGSMRRLPLQFCNSTQVFQQR